MGTYTRTKIFVGGGTYGRTNILEGVDLHTNERMNEQTYLKGGDVHTKKQTNMFLSTLESGKQLLDQIPFHFVEKQNREF